MQACKLIDSHFHLYTAGLDIASAGDALQRVSHTTGIDTISIACAPVPLLPAFDGRQVFLALLLKSLQPKQTYVFGALDYTGAGAPEGKADFAAQARRLFEMGVDGFKMLEGKPTSRRILKIPMDAPAYDPFYEFLEEKSLPILAHVADPAICWDAQNAPTHFKSAGYFYADGSLPTFEGFRTEALNVAKKHPGLKLTLAHFFFASADVDQAAQIMERHPNIAFDLTPGFDMYAGFAAKPDEWRDFFVRYDTRILFGTDNGLPGRVDAASLIKMFHDKVNFIRSFLETDAEVVVDICGFTYRTRGLHLPRRTVKRIGAANYIHRLSSKAPRPLERALILSECKQRMERLQSGKNDLPKQDTELAALEQIAVLLHDAEQETLR